ncbi:MAG: DsbA family protein [Pseudomonadota bacterium]
MKRRLLLTAMGATALGGLGAPLLRGRAGAPWGAAHAQEAESSVELVEMAQGSDDAPVELIEYASLTCGFCARFHVEVYPQLKENYIDTGLVRYVVREVYLDRFGLWASMVARCAGPVRFFGVTDILYETQREWATGDPATVAENLRRIGRTVGMSDDELQTCLTDGAFAQALVDRYEGFAEVHDIPGTPTFYINDEQHSNMGYSELAGVLDAAIEAAG